jgi:hypothetical protein
VQKKGAHHDPIHSCESHRHERHCSTHTAADSVTIDEATDLCHCYYNSCASKKNFNAVSALNKSGEKGRISGVHIAAPVLCRKPRAAPL